MILAWVHRPYGVEYDKLEAGKPLPLPPDALVLVIPRLLPLIEAIPRNDPPPVHAEMGAPLPSVSMT